MARYVPGPLPRSHLFSIPKTFAPEPFVAHTATRPLPNPLCGMLVWLGSIVVSCLSLALWWLNLEADYQSVDGGLQRGLSSEPHGPGPVVLCQSLEKRTQGFVFLTSFERTGQLG